MSNIIEVLIDQGLDVSNICKDVPNFVKNILNFVKDASNFANDVPRVSKSILRWEIPPITT